MTDASLKRFQKRMRSLPKDVREGVRPALVKSAEEIAALARTLAPEDSGALRDSIEVTGPGMQTPPYSQPGGAAMVGSNQAAVTAGNTEVRYAHLVEYGTTKAPAHPFFWPAYRLLKKRSVNRIKRAMSKAIKQRRGAR